MSCSWCTEILRSLSNAKNVADIEHIKVQSCFLSEWLGEQIEAEIPRPL